MAANILVSFSTAQAAQLSASDCAVLRGATVGTFKAPQLQGRLSPVFTSSWLNYIKSGCMGPVEIPTPGDLDIAALLTISQLAGKNGISFEHAGIKAVAGETSPAPEIRAPRP